MVVNRLAPGCLRGGYAGVDALFAANIRTADVGPDYFARRHPPSSLRRYWSPAVEEQFYVVWPALLVCLVLLRWRGRSGILPDVCAVPGQESPLKRQGVSAAGLRRRTPRGYLTMRDSEHVTPDYARWLATPLAAELGIGGSSGTG